ncbi:DUF3152 domain-containing protein [Nocardioides sp. Root190]|uniref:DUF3152 domain-containing protein n=1 Tax=Nocardioides sp. Root190 TaxID=1736488 RepID=UPI0009E81D99|nr:DUF3152 domain-containing protein [Nocardioides sp. Root190]
MSTDHPPPQSPQTTTSTTAHAASTGSQKKAAAPRTAPPVPSAPPASTPLVQGPPASVPENGPAVFNTAPGRTDATGAGRLVTYTVELEQGLPFNAKTVASLIDRTLADPRGWTAGGLQSVRRVADNADLRILIASPKTTDELCAPLITGGRLSCRNGARVVLNAWRWAHGADAYKSIQEYRRYLVNHEVGHALGNAHEGCISSGRRASVMLQQTKGLQGCLPNPWPFP